MQHWEYLFVDFFSYGGELRARRVDGQAGREGWELVAVNVGDSSAQLVFKRPQS